MKNLIYIAAMLLCSIANGQVSTPYITGKVSAYNHRVLPGVKVILDNAVQRVDSTLSDSSGNYIFNNPAPGLYYVYAADSMHKSSKQLIQVSTGIGVEQNITAYEVMIIINSSDPVRPQPKDSRNYNATRDSEYNRKDIIGTPK